MGSGLLSGWLFGRDQVATSEATPRLPAVAADSVHEGRNPLARVEGVRFVGYADGVATYRLPSGSYRLTSRLR